MGRKPNKLVLEYFERGAKIDDASNRYEHTCKACGEKFPKGRIEGLTSHIFKKCPSISVRSRQKALLEFNELPTDIHAAAVAKKANGQKASGLGKGRTVELPIGKPNWTPLEALAEVSRQVGGQGKGKEKGSNDADGKEGLGANGHPQEMDQVLSAISYPPRIATMSTSAENIAGLAASSGLDEAAQLRSALSLTAQSANEHLSASAAEQQRMSIDASIDVDVDMSEEAISDKFFQHPSQDATGPGMGAKSAHTWPLPQHDPQIDPAIYESVQEYAAVMESAQQQHRAATFPRPIAMNPNGVMAERGGDVESGADSSRSSALVRPKVRGRFTAERRKEVQQIRKQGACIRCRMLKKPCSNGSPCSACKSVESARLWKHPCIRTKLSEELEMYSSGLHFQVAFDAVNDIQTLYDSSPSDTPLQASHFPHAGIVITLVVLNGTLQPDRSTIPKHLSALLSSADVSALPTTLYLLDPESNDALTQLQAYLPLTTAHFLTSEPSALIREALTTLTNLAAQKDDKQLSRALELWTLTQILTTTTTPSRSSSSSIDDISRPKWHFASSSPSSPPPNLLSTKLLDLQLAGQTERLSATLTKQVLNDLESRLQKRPPNTTLDTFCMALVVLESVQRMVSYLQSTFLSSTAPNQEAEIETEKAWPLEKSTPGYYVAQAERFCQLVIELLRIRHYLPRTHVNDEIGKVRAMGGTADEMDAFFEHADVAADEVRGFVRGAVLPWTLTRDS